MRHRAADYTIASAMSSSAPARDTVAPGAANFALTRWSLVLAASRSKTTQARNALEQLCRAYWFPIYAFIRRQGHKPPDAQDLTQEFFARLIEKNYLHQADQAKGRFRSFLLASLKHFLANEYHKARAQKRGGGAVVLSLDARMAENHYAAEPVDGLSPDKLFERRWALTLLENVLSRLRAEYTEAGRTDLFEQLKPALTGERQALGYAAIAGRLGMSEGALKVAVHRVRQRFRQVLREEIAQTVATSAEIDEELRALFATLSE